MTAFSVAEARNNLPRLIDKALSGEPVTITRHGKPVAELRPVEPADDPAAPGSDAWLIARRDSRPGMPFTAVELLDMVYESSA